MNTYIVFMKSFGITIYSTNPITTIFQYDEQGIIIYIIVFLIFY